jgi:hypothetical protein
MLPALEMGRYTTPEGLFVSECHTGNYQYTLHPFTFFFTIF